MKSVTTTRIATDLAHDSNRRRAQLLQQVGQKSGQIENPDFVSHVARVMPRSHVDHHDSRAGRKQAQTRRRIVAAVL
jgi:hypothetical protein